MIRFLLQKSPSDRTSKDGFEGIKKMKYFQGVDWKNLTKMNAPYVPKKFRKVSS